MHPYKIMFGMNLFLTIMHLNAIVNNNNETLILLMSFLRAREQSKRFFACTFRIRDICRQQAHIECFAARAPDHTLIPRPFFVITASGYYQKFMLHINRQKGVYVKQIRKPTRNDTPAKIALIIALYAGAALITASGALFMVYSFAQNIRISILSISIPGFVVALLMLFFGIRSFFSVRKLRHVVLKDSSHLSLGIFKNRPFKSRTI